MDEAVNPVMLAVLLLTLGGAHAQQLQDPTRPAMAVSESVMGVGAGSAAPLMQLQSVLIGRGGRKVAVISGRIMRVGDRFGDAVLTKISDDGVVLRIGTKLTVLKLFPALQMRRTGAASGLDVEQ